MLRITYIPQVPMQPFIKTVETVEEAVLVANTLVEFSTFEFENHVKPDYSDALDLEEFVDDEWISWEDPETGYDFSDYLEEANN